jgi:precorrin-6B C5,15-methyltransferase / cobalt-precorrin-6B C5,C15-methyltransferase
VTGPAIEPPWLSIIGIGEDGRDGLSLAARERLAQAALVVGGKRHLALAAPFEAETMEWPSPLAEGIPLILARRGEPVCVLASGDPFYYGVGALLAAALPPSEYACLPAPSSFSLAASRLGWSLQDCRLISLHGRELTRIVPHIQPRAKIIALTWDETTPALLADLLCGLGCSGSTLHVLESLGGPREVCRRAYAEGFNLRDIGALNVVAVEVSADRHARLLPLTPGLQEDWFEHDGQITKREVRAITLSALRPMRGGHLWDIGAGSGSVAIEWALLDLANRATAIEAQPERAARITANAKRLGVPGVAVVEGRAPDALANLPKPDAVFVGGGISDNGVIGAAFAALPPGGRLVVNAVTLEAQARLIELHRHRGGDLTTIAIAHADPVGRFHGWRPAMPITQWSVSKAWNEADDIGQPR